MTSKIVVNNIEADSGINTVTFNSNISGNFVGNVNTTGVSTFTTINIGTGTSISSPATNVLALGTNNVERVRIDSSGRLGIGTDNPTGNGDQTTIHVHAADYPVLHLTNSTTGTAASDGSELTLNSDGSLILRNRENSFIRFDTNGSERLRIDSSGRVTMPSQVAFHVPKTAGDTLTTTAAKLSFSSATYDVGSNYSDANDRFTAPVAGKYFFYTSINVLNSGNASLIYIRKNGSTYGQIFYAATNYPRMDFNPVGIIDLAASDYVEIYGSISSGTVSVDNAGYFGGYLLG